MQRTNEVTPAGIRHDYAIHQKPKHLAWSRTALKGLAYIVTDKGPLKRWVWIIGRSQEQLCACGEVQNAVHIRRCGLVGDGKGRSIEEAMKDREWCEEVAVFLNS